MLEYLEMTGVGPAEQMRVGFSPRLNILTGDNGLGKTFVLDVAWWALTGSWARLSALPHKMAQAGHHLCVSRRCLAG